MLTSPMSSSVPNRLSARMPRAEARPAPRVITTGESVRARWASGHTLSVQSRAPAAARLHARAAHPHLSREVDLFAARRDVGRACGDLSWCLLRRAVAGAGSCSRAMSPAGKVLEAFGHQFVALCAVCAEAGHAGVVR